MIWETLTVEVTDRLAVVTVNRPQVRMVRALRAELGTEHGTVNRVARQLGYGVESVRSWVRQADIDDGYAPGVSTAEARRVKELEQEIRELKRARF